MISQAGRIRYAVRPGQRSVIWHTFLSYANIYKKNVPFLVNVTYMTKSIDNRPHLVYTRNIYKMYTLLIYIRKREIKQEVDRA